MRHLPDAASSDLRHLAEAALAGGAISRGALSRRGAQDMVHKAPRDYQTEIDVAVERALVAALAERFPDLAISGEEGADDRTGTGRREIIIDPIDGTTNFAWGIPHFGLTIAILEDREPVAGVVYDAMADEMFAAEAGQGAWLNGAILRCEANADMVDTLIGAGLPIPGQVRTIPVESYHSALRRIMDTTAGIRRLGSAALSSVYVACGRLDGFFEDGLALHDYGAAGLILREAGGVTTCLDGAPLTERRGVLFAATPEIHGWLLEGLTG